MAEFTDNQARANSYLERFNRSLWSYREIRTTFTG